MSSLIVGAALTVAACQPAYVPACRLAGAQVSLDLSGTQPNLGFAGGGVALSTVPGGKVQARWWRPVPTLDGGASLPSGPTAEQAVFASDGSLEERSSTLVPDAWEGSPGRNPARMFVATANGVAAAVSVTRARVQPDLTVQLRTFLRFTAVASETGALSVAELTDTSCFDCQLWATVQRVEPANAVLVAQLPPSGLGSVDRLGAAVLTVDDEGLVQARMVIPNSEELPVLVARTPTDAVALLSGTTLRLWNATLTGVGPPIELGAQATALDWNLAASELVAGTADAQGVFLAAVAWSSPGRAERFRVSAGAGVFAVARGVQGPAMVFGDGEQVFFAHVDDQGRKRGPDVPLTPLEHGAVDGRGVLVELPDVPGGFAYFSASAAGIDRHEVRCE